MAPHLAPHPLIPQLNRVFQSLAPIIGYVDVWTGTPGGAFVAYGSVVDNGTGDPTTISPQEPVGRAPPVPGRKAASGATQGNMPGRLGRLSARAPTIPSVACGRAAPGFVT